MLSESDVAPCFWLGAWIAGSEGWIEGRGLPFTHFMHNPPEIQMPRTFLTMMKNG